MQPPVHICPNTTCAATTGVLCQVNQASVLNLQHAKLQSASTLQAAKIVNCLPCNSVNDVSGLVHDNDSRRAQVTLNRPEGVIIHQNIITERSGQQWGAGPARNDCQQVVPASPNTTCISQQEPQPGDSRASTW
jgi:hypothetical protein